MKPFHNPFGALGERFGIKPEPALDSIDASTEAETPPSPTGSVIPRAIVRIERTGRGGKEVTIVEHLELRPADRETWLKALKSSLGCGGAVEGDALILQGDHRSRLPAILTARGVKRVTVAR